MSQLKSQVLHFNFLRNQDFNIILSLTGIIGDLLIVHEERTITIDT